VLTARVLSIVGLAIAFLALGIVAAGEGPLWGDTVGIKLSQELAFEPVARAFEGPIDRYVLPALAVAGVIVAVGRRRLDLAVVLALTWPSASLNSAVKRIVERPRPDGDFAILSTPDTWSFPSGHAYLAAAVCGGWLLLAGTLPGQWWGRAVTVVSLALILLAGFSRIWLGAHWPTDVLGAWLLAALVLLLASPIGRLAAACLARVAGGSTTGGP